MLSVLRGRSEVESLMNVNAYENEYEYECHFRCVRIEDRTNVTKSTKQHKNNRNTLSKRIQLQQNSYLASMYEICQRVSMCITVQQQAATSNKLS